MKINQTKLEVNPLKEILDVFTVEEVKNLTLLQLRTVGKLLETSGIYCSSNEEIVECLEILQSLNALDIKQKDSNLQVKNLLW